MRCRWLRYRAFWPRGSAAPPPPEPPSHPSRPPSVWNNPLGGLVLLLAASPAWSLPTGGAVSTGNAAIRQPSAKSLHIDQASRKAVLSWLSFDIAADEAVTFQQPSERAVTLNRVLGNDPSAIFGRLNANGQVFLINPNGILFGRDARVDVGGIVASTLDLSDRDFLDGRYRFSSGDHTGEVVNEGAVRAADGGYIALLGRRVLNAGTLSAPGGSVALGAGARMTLDFNGDGLLSLEVDAAAAGARVSSPGVIEANGGAVVVSARAKDALLDTVLNVEGTIRARGVVEREGAIYLDGGPSGVTRVSGTLDASGTAAQARGGRIEVLGANVGLFDGARIDASGATGGGEVLVGGDFQGRNPQVRNAARTYIAPDAVVTAGATKAGDGGTVIVWADQVTHHAGEINARGGQSGGDGGFVEVSGKQALQFRGAVDTGAPAGRAGTLLLDPNDLVIANGGQGDLTGTSGDDGDAQIYAFGEDDGEPTTLGANAVTSALLTGNVELQANSTIAVQEAVNGGATNNSLTLRAGGTVTVDAAIVLQGGDIRIFTNDVAATGSNGSIVVNAALDTTGSGASSGAITLDTQSGTGTIDLNANLTTDNATVTLSGSARLTGPAVISTGLASGGNIVAAAVDSDISNRNLALTSGTGIVTVTGAVGAGNPLGILQLVETGGATFGSSLAAASFDNDDADSTVSFQGSTTFTSIDTLVGSTLDFAGQTLAVENGDIRGTLAGAAGALTKTGAGTLVLSGANAYTGATTVNAGTLVAGNDDALGMGLGTTAVSAGATLLVANAVTVANEALDLSGTLAGAAGNAQFGGDITLDGAAAALSAAAGASFTVSGAISDGATTALTKAGAGTVILSGANTYTGATMVNAGTLRLGAAGAVPDASAVTVSGTLDLNDFAETVGSLAGAGNVTLGSASLTAGGNNASTAFSGVLSGTGGLSKAGTGILTLSGTNTYTGATTVSAGTLIAGNAAALGTIAAGTTVDDGATLQVANTVTVVNEALSLSGTLQGEGAASYNGAITLADAEGIVSTTPDAAATFMLGGTIDGAGALTKQGTGTVVLSGANTYTGATTVSAGTLIAGNAAALGTIAAGTTVDDGATLQVANTVTVVNEALSLSGTLQGEGAASYNGAITLADAEGIVSTTPDAAATFMLGGTIDGAGALTKQGTGTVVLSGANTYTGATTVSAGTLIAGNAAALGTIAAGTTVDDGATLQVANTVTVVNEALSLSGTLQGEGAASYNGAITLADAEGIVSTTPDAAATFMLGGTIDGAGALTKQGTGTVVLSGANTYTGATTVSAGTLIAGNAAALGTIAAGTTVDDGATLQVANTVTVVNEALSLSGTLQGEGAASYNGAITLADAEGIVSTTPDAAATFMLGGTIDGAGALTKQGMGTVVLSGANTYTGATMVNAGTLRLGAAGVIPDASAVTVSGTLDLNDFTETVGSLAGAGNVTLGSATLTAGGNNASTVFSGVLSGTGGLSKAGTGILTLGGINTFTGTTAANIGTLRLGAAGVIPDASAVTVSGTLDLNDFAETVGSLAGAGNVTLGSATLTAGGNNASTTFSGVLSGTGGLSKAGNGILTLGGTNTYSGATLVNAGTLRLGAAGVIPDASAVTVGGTLDLNDFTETVGSLAGAGNVTLGSATLTAGGNNTDTTFSGLLSGTGGLSKAGTGILTLSGINTYAGATLVSAGTLVANNDDALGMAGAGTTVATGATLRVANGIMVAAEALSLAGTLAGTGTSAFGGAIALSDPAAALSADAGSAFTVSGVIDDGAATALTKAGAGTVILSGANTYTGATTVNAGTLRLGAAGVIPDASAVTVSGTLDLNDFAETVGSLAGAGNVTLGSATLTAGGNDASTTFSGVLSGTGGLSKAGTGILTLSGTNTYTGATLVNAGTLRLGAAGVIPDASAVTVSGTLDLNDFTETVGSLAGAGNVTLGSATLTAGGNNTSTTFSGVLSGTGGLSKAGTGILTLGGTNTYSGATRVNAGTLRLGAAGVIPDASAVTVSGTLDLNDFAETVGSLAGAGNVTLGSATLTTGGNNTSTTFSGVLSGTGGLSKAGTGILTLGGTNTYSGATLVNAGTLRLGAAGVIPDTSAVTVSGTLDLNDFVETVGSLAGAGNVTLGSAALTAGGNNASTTFSGVLSGTGGLSKAGTGILTLGGTNSFSGATRVDAGTLRLGAAGVIPDTSAVTVSGTLDLNDFVETVGALAGAGNVTLGSATLTAGGNNTSTTFSGLLSGAGGLSKAGTGILTLSGINTYTGATTVSAGTLRLGAAGVIPDASAVTVSGTLDLNDFVETVGSLAGAGNVTLGSATLTAGGNNTDTTFSGVLSGTGELSKAGTGILTLGGLNTYTGATTVSAGTLRLGAAGVIPDASAVTVSGTLDLNDFTETVGSLAGAGNVTLGAATLTAGGNNASTTFSGVLSGTGGLSKAGTGILTLGGTNSFSGATTVNAGTLRLGAAGVIPDASAVTVGGTLDLNDFTETVGSLAGAGNVTLGSATLTAGGNNASSTFSGVLSGTGGLSKAGTGILTLGGTNTYSGATLLNTGTLRLGAAGVIPDASAVTVSGTLDLNDFTETVGSLAGAGNVTLGSATLTAGGNNASTTFSGLLSGAGGLSKAGTGILTFSGINTYTGATTVSAGTLRLGAAGVIPDASAVTVSGTLDLNDFTETVGSLAGAGNVTLGSATLTAGGNNASTTFSGVLSGTGGLSKAGNGILTLSGINTYTGATTVSAGTLRLGAAGVIPDASALTVSGTLDLNDFTETVGSLAGTGNVTLGSATLTAGGNNASTTFSGLLSGTGGLSKAGTGILTLSGINTYTGATLVSAGTLVANNDDALGMAGAGTTVATGATLRVANGIMVAAEALSLAGTLQGEGAASYNGAITLADAQGVVSTTPDTAATFMLGGTIDGAGALTKQGTGTVVLSAANTYTGATTVNAGALVAGNAAALGTAAAGTTVADGTTLRVADGVTVANEALSLSGTLAGAGNAEFGGDITLDGAAAGLSAAAGARFTVSGDIGDGATTALTKAGVGTVVLSGMNTYTGATTISAGTLVAGNVAALGTAAAGTTVANGATLQVADTVTVANEALSLSGTLQGEGAASYNGAITLADAQGIVSTTPDAAATFTLGGVIDGAGALTKQGMGTVVLSAANTYTGATAVNAGTLRLGAAGVIPDASAVTVSGTLDLNDFTETVGSLAGAGNVTLGSASLTAGGNNASTVFSGVLSGTGGLSKAGTGILTLGGINTYTGATAVNAGTLRLGAAGVIPDASAVTVGGTLDLNDFTETVGSLAGTGNATLSSATLTAGGNNTDTTFSGVLSGTGGLSKAGTGILTLGGINTYTGATMVSAGTLVAGSAAALGTAAAGTTVADGATLQVADTVTVTNEALSLSGTLAGAGNAAFGGDITLDGAAAELSAAAGARFTVRGDIGNGATTALAKGGAGTVMLSGTNTYTGPTTVSGGTLAVTGGDAIPDASRVTLNQATLDLLDSETIGTIEDEASSGVVLNASTLILAGAGDANLAGRLDSAGGKILKQGAGGLTLGTLATGGDLTLSVAAGDLDLGRGSVNGGLAATSSRGIVQAGPLNVTGDVRFNADVVLLDDTGNQLGGSVTATAEIVRLASQSIEVGADGITAVTIALRTNELSSRDNAFITVNDTNVTNTGLTLRALPGNEGVFGTLLDPVLVDMLNVIVVEPDVNTASGIVFLAGPSERKPRHEGVRDVRYNFVPTPPPLSEGAINAAVAPLSTLLSDVLASGFSQENVRRELAQGLVLEVGAAPPAIDDILFNDVGDFGIRMPRVAEDCDEGPGTLGCFSR